ncbi:hypothetical protein ACFC0M_05360 [Streptomyces sp. NPDC056149]|uniref:hypothetical protein n=1 Tax=Streptomyces sp. NPDC056149 TaxID=3345728 RepID=UPI0035D9D4C5
MGEGVASAGVAVKPAIVAQAARPPITHLGQVKRERIPAPSWTTGAPEEAEA